MGEFSPPPPWTGRPQGPPPGTVVSELALARSEAAAVYIGYLDAYPDGFELGVEAITDGTKHGLRWPMPARAGTRPLHSC